MKDNVYGYQIIPKTTLKKKYDTDYKTIGSIGTF